MNTVRRNALFCRHFLLHVVISEALALGCSTAMAQSADYDSLVQTAIGQRKKKSWGEMTRTGFQSSR